MAQDEFCQKIKPYPLKRERAKLDSSPLTPEELTGFRAILGALLWLCQTRLDIIADVVLSQQDVAKATIGTLKNANAIVTRAKKYAQDCGLYFPPLDLPLKMATVCDSSHASKTTSYAQEGVLILLMHDKRLELVTSETPLYKELKQGDSMSGFCHVLASLSHKAKRIGASSSNAETLSATVGKELAQLVAIRLTEIFGVGMQTPLKNPATYSLFIKIQEEGDWVIPIDHFTDCRDVFHLVVGEKGVPQDRYQRLYILALREDRIKGTIRYFIWIPTAAMLADPLTKSMISPMLYDLINHGYWGMKGIGPNGQVQKPLVAHQDQYTLEYSEED